MGSCMSSNATINVQRYNYPKKNNNKTIGCFTSLCKGEDNLENKNFSEIVPNPNIKSSFSIRYDENKLNNEINLFIEKYKSQIRLKKINFIQLYNLFMNYKYDFTKSDLVLCDTREDLKEKNKTLFLKHFPKINNDIRQLEIMDKNRLNKFFKFLKNKNIIFILKNSNTENSVDIVEKFVIFFLANQNKVSIGTILILSEYITKIEETDITTDKKEEKENMILSYKENIYNFIDEDLLYIYSPKILINISDIQSSFLNYNSEIIHNSYIFFDVFEHNEFKDNNKKENFKINNKFDINYLNNSETLETDIYLNFIYKFNIIYIINFTIIDEIDYNINKKSYKYIWHCEAKRNKAFKENKKSLIKQKNILIPKNLEFIEYYKIIHNEFIPILEELKDQVINNNCILLQFDDKIEYIFLMKFLYLITFKITVLSFDNIYEYFKINFIDLNKESSIKEQKGEFLNFLV